MAHMTLYCDWMARLVSCFVWPSCPVLWLISPQACLLCLSTTSVRGGGSAHRGRVAGCADSASVFLLRTWTHKHTPWIALGAKWPNTGHLYNSHNMQFSCWLHLVNILNCTVTLSSTWRIWHQDQRLIEEILFLGCLIYNPQTDLNSVHF